MNEHPAGACCADPEVQQQISDWLVGEALRHADVETILGGVCARLLAAGVPLWRVYVGMRTLHPSIYSVDYIWERGRGVRAERHSHEAAIGAEWARSPFRHLLERGETRLRRRLQTDGAGADFPLLRDLIAQGASDYFARVLRFPIAAIDDDRTGLIASWTSDAPQGFSDADLSIIERLLPRLGLTMKVSLTEQIAANLLDTYVGPAAGRRILSGEIQRGAMECIPAVIWYADLRDFTCVTDSVDRDELAPMINAYFECMVEPVVARGGQVLKFLGDGLLATFSLERRREDVLCDAALGAAVIALERTAALNVERAAAGAPTMGLDIALHHGEVLYGNVGADDRLDFTVIGPAVNEASRIEVLCRDLGRNILISEAFAHAATRCRAHLVSLGRHRLRGVREPQELFTLEPAPPPCVGDLAALSAQP